MELRIEPEYLPTAYIGTNTLCIKDREEHIDHYISVVRRSRAFRFTRGNLLAGY